MVVKKLLERPCHEASKGTKRHKGFYRKVLSVAAMAMVALTLLSACNPVVAPPAEPGPTDVPTPGGMNDGVPDPVAALQVAYGAPSQAAFGSAAFYAPQTGDANLETLALEQYKYFVGDLWDRYGEAAWMGPWRQVYARPAGATPDIVAELRAIDDFDASLSVPMILEAVDEADQARAALAAVYDDPAMSEVAVYTIGDGGAMSGLLVAGRRTTGDAVFLVFLLD